MKGDVYMKNDIKEIATGLSVYPRYVFYKFQSQSILSDLQMKGHIYLKNLQYYINLENETGDDVKGDREECILFESNLKLVVNEGTETEQVINLGKSEIRNADDPYKPAYCMSCVNLFDHVIDVSYPKVEAIPRFDQKILNGFNNGCESLYVLIIADPITFQKRIKNKLYDLSIKYESGFVTYRDTSKLHNIDGNIELNGPFFKREKYSYQKEFRYILDKKISIDEFYDFYIGDISDISYLCKADELFTDDLKYIINLEK
jgi:hypothetical protein